MSGANLTTTPCTYPPIEVVASRNNLNGSISVNVSSTSSQTTIKISDSLITTHHDHHNQSQLYEHNQLQGEHNLNPPSQMPVVVQSYHEVDWVIVGCMLGLLAVLITVFLYIILPPLLSWLKYLIPVSPKRIERRYHTIETWLVTKRVRKHDSYCELIQEQKNQMTYQRKSLDKQNPKKRVCGNDCFRPLSKNSVDERTFDIIDTISKNSTSDDLALCLESKEGIKLSQDKNNFGKPCSTSGRKGNDIIRNCSSTGSIASSNPIKTTGSEDTAETVLTLEDECDEFHEKETIPTPNDQINVISNGSDDNDIFTATVSDVYDNDLDSVFDGSDGTIDFTSNDDYENEDGDECPICYESLNEVGTIVSWSPHRNCDHVFHHQCIKEWLLYHDTCPCCRVQLLLVDANSRDFSDIMQLHVQGRPPTTEDSSVKFISTTHAQQQRQLHEQQSHQHEHRQQQRPPSEEAELPSNGPVTATAYESENNRRRAVYENNESSSHIHRSNTKQTSRSSNPWTMEQLQCLAHIHFIRSKSTYYCNQHGLVTISASAASEIKWTCCSSQQKPKSSLPSKLRLRSTTATAIKMLTASNVQAEDLIALREKTGLADRSISTNDGDVAMDTSQDDEEQQLPHPQQQSQTLLTPTSDNTASLNNSGQGTLEDIQEINENGMELVAIGCKSNENPSVRNKTILQEQG